MTAYYLGVFFASLLMAGLTSYFLAPLLMVAFPTMALWITPLLFGASFLLSVFNPIRIDFIKNFFFGWAVGEALPELSNLMHRLRGTSPKTHWSVRSTNAFLVTTLEYVSFVLVGSFIPINIMLYPFSGPLGFLKNRMLMTIPLGTASLRRYDIRALHRKLDAQPHEKHRFVRKMTTRRLARMLLGYQFGFFFGLGSIVGLMVTGLLSLIQTPMLLVGLSVQPAFLIGGIAFVLLWHVLSPYRLIMLERALDQPGRPRTTITAFGVGFIQTAQATCRALLQIMIPGAEFFLSIIPNDPHTRSPYNRSGKLMALLTIAAYASWTLTPILLEAGLLLPVLMAGTLLSPHLVVGVTVFFLARLNISDTGFWNPPPTRATIRSNREEWIRGFVGTIPNYIALWVTVPMHAITNGILAIQEFGFLFWAAKPTWRSEEPERVRKTHNLGIDVEMEEEREEEKEHQVEVQYAQETGEDDALHDGMQIFRFDEFEKFKKFLIKKDHAQYNHPQKQEEIRQYWNHWFGHIEPAGCNPNQRWLGLNAHLTGITERGIETLLEHARCFEYGIDFDHLPDGFKILSQGVDASTERTQRILDFLPPKPDQRPPKAGLAIRLNNSPALLDEKQEARTPDEIIGHFSDHEKQWWDQLLALHLKAHPQDIGPDGNLVNLLTLLESFEAFRGSIQSLGLEFYPLKNPDFQALQEQAINLPVMLGRIIGVLKRVDEADRAAQWKVISQLDWSPTGVIRAFQDHEGKPTRCGFVVPEMQVTAARFALTPQESKRGYFLSHDHETFKQNPSTDSLAPCDDIPDEKLTIEDIQRTYFRKISHQEKRLPLEMYQQAFDKIMAFREEQHEPSIRIRKILACLFLFSTTAEHYNSVAGKDPEAADAPLALWEKFLTDLNQISTNPVIIDVRPRLAAFKHVLFGAAKVTDLLPGDSNFERELKDGVMTIGLGADMNISTESLLLNLQFFRHFPSDLPQITNLTSLERNVCQETYENGLEELGNMTYSNLNSAYVLFNADVDVDPLAVMLESGHGRLINLLKLFVLVEKLGGSNSFDAVRFFDQDTPLATLFRYGEVFKQSNKPHESIIFLNELKVILSQHHFLRRIPSNIPQDTHVLEIMNLLQNNVDDDELVKIIDTVLERKKQENLSYLKLRPLISTFDFDEKTFEKSAELLINSPAMTDPKAMPVFEILKHLRRNKRSNGEKLIPQDFETLIGKINALFEQSLDEASFETALMGILKSDLGDCFDPDFLDELGQQKIAEWVDKRLSATFPERAIQTKIRKILGHLDHENHPEYSEEIQTTFADALKKFSPRKMQELLKVLTRASLYRSRNGNKIKAAEFLSLMRTLTNNGDIQKLLLFFEQPACADEKMTDLIPKATVFISEAVPHINDRIKYNSDNPLKKLELYPLLSESLIQEPTDFDQKNSEPHINKLLGHLFQLTEKYPASKEQFLMYLKQNTNGLQARADDVEQLAKHLIPLSDPTLIRTLLFHATENKVINVRILLGLLENIQTTSSATQPNLLQWGLSRLLKGKQSEPGPNTAKILLNMVACLLNNEQFTSNDFIQLKDVFKNLYLQESIEFAKFIDSVFQQAPYPSVAQLIAWLKSSQEKPGEESSKLKIQYAAFDLKPCERDLRVNNGIPQNGFHQDFAKQQIKLFGVNLPAEQNQDIIDQLSEATEAVKNKTTAELVKTLLQGSELSLANRIALAAEILYRSKGNTAHTYELNTTQYLALYFQLAVSKPGTPVTTQMYTGEGKSRIDILTAALLATAGHTVDLCTSDMPLAMRDFQEFQAFFKTLNIPTNLIYAYSDFSEYQMNANDNPDIGGVNFTTVPHLQLFRNRARYDAQIDQALHSDPTKRALVNAEGDKVQFDSYATDYNYSTSSNGENVLEEMEWLYPALVDFFKGEKPKSNSSVYQKPDECLKEFKAYLAANPDSQPLQQLNECSDTEIKIWLRSAADALSLEFEKDFVIQPDVVVSSSYGPVVSSQAYLISEYRVSKNSKFSMGVHQCLHARLNRLREKYLKKHDNSSLCQALLACKQPFQIEPEKLIAYHSTSHDFFKTYEKAPRFDSTGSSGSDLERLEAKTLKKMEYVDAPRHNPLQRIDDPIRLAADFEDQIDQIVEEIFDAQRQGEFILVFAENDEESALLYTRLQEYVNAAQLQRIDSQCHNEAELIKKQQTPQMVTVCTPQTARGVQNPGRGRVLTTFLPTERNLIQIFGRVGRYGEPGNARMILNKQRLKTEMGLSTLNTRHGYYTSTDTWLARQQAQMDRKSQLQRLIKGRAEGFETQLTEHFWNNNTPRTSEDKKHWRKYLRAQRALWANTWEQIQAVLNHEPSCWDNLKDLLFYRKQSDFSQIDDLLKQYENQVFADDGPWKNLLKFCPDSMEAFEADQQPHCELDQLTQTVLGGFNLYKTAPHRIKIFSSWQKALGGRSAVFDRFFAETRATLWGERELFANTKAWWNGHGILFANTRATLSGERPLFANTRWTLYTLYQEGFNPKPQPGQPAIKQRPTWRL